MKIMNFFADWPPSAAGAYGRGQQFSPTAADHAMVESFVWIVGNCVHLSCRFEAQGIRYCIDAPDEEAARWLATILESNKGKTLFAIGMIDVPEEVVAAVLDCPV